MNEPRSLMTKRTFGLLSMLSLLTTGIFTATLVLAYPNPTVSTIEEQNLSDTRSIDSARTIANTDSAEQAKASSSQDSPSRATSSPALGQAAPQALTQQTAVSPQATTPVSTSQPAQRPSTQSPASTPQAEQPGPVAFVRDTIDKVADLLNL